MGDLPKLRRLPTPWRSGLTPLPRVGALGVRAAEDEGDSAVAQGVPVARGKRRRFSPAPSARPMPLRFLVAVLLAAAAAAPARAQPDVRADGFTRLYGAVRADPSAPPDEADYLALLSRAELGLRADYDRGAIRLRLRADYDALAPYSGQDASADVPGDGRLDLRLVEAYADVFVGKVDIRVGRQVLAWGETDGAFITDLLAPLDLTRFLAQDAADLRLGLTAVRATAYLGRLTADAVLVPRAAPSLLPARQSPWDPIPTDVAGVPVELEAPALPSPTLGHGEAALRLTWSGIDRTDLALILFTGHNRLPAFDKRLRASFAEGLRAVLTPVYRRRQVVGLTAETARLETFVLRAEAAYTSAELFDEALDLPEPITPAALFDPDLAAAAGRGFLLAKPTVQAALGAERFFGKHLVRLTGLARVVLEWDERVAERRFTPSVTALYAAPFRRETVQLRALALVGIEGDYWLSPSAAYTVSDGLVLTLGAHVFGGSGGADSDTALLDESSSSFGLYDRNDLVFLQLQYGF